MSSEMLERLDNARDMDGIAWFYSNAGDAPRHDTDTFWYLNGRPAILLAIGGRDGADRTSVFRFQTNDGAITDVWWTAEGKLPGVTEMIAHHAAPAMQS